MPAHRRSEARKAHWRNPAGGADYSRCAYRILTALPVRTDWISFWHITRASRASLALRKSQATPLRTLLTAACSSAVNALMGLPPPGSLGCLGAPLME